MRDLIDNRWIPSNLSFLSSGPATQWSRGDALSSEKWWRLGPKITQRAAGPGNCPCPGLLSFPPQIHSQPGGQGVTCSSILKYASVGS